MTRTDLGAGRARYTVSRPDVAAIVCARLIVAIVCALTLIVLKIGLPPL